MGRWRLRSWRLQGAEVMRDLARMVLDGEFNELESWRTSEDPVKQAVYDLALEAKKGQRGPAYSAATHIFRRIQNQNSVRLEWDHTRIEDELLAWERIIKDNISAKGMP
jgi:hypothetical protein